MAPVFEGISDGDRVIVRFSMGGLGIRPVRRAGDLFIAAGAWFDLDGKCTDGHGYEVYSIANETLYRKALVEMIRFYVDRPAFAKADIKLLESIFEMVKE